MASLSAAEAVLAFLDSTLTRLDALRAEGRDEDACLLDLRRGTRELFEALARLGEESAARTGLVNERSIALESMLKEKEIILAELAASCGTPVSDGVIEKGDVVVTPVLDDAAMGAAATIAAEHEHESEGEQDVKTMLETKLKRVRAELATRRELKAELDGLHQKRAKIEAEHRDVLLRCHAAQKVFKGLTPHALQPLASYFKLHKQFAPAGGGDGEGNGDEKVRARVGELAVPLQMLWYRLKAGSGDVKLADGEGDVLTVLVVGSGGEAGKMVRFRIREDEEAGAPLRVTVQVQEEEEVSTPAWAQDFAGLTSAGSFGEGRITVKTALDRLLLVKQ